jgi:hypothetical protein
MTTGNPHLACWTALDGILRLYELDSNNVFVQIASSSCAHSGSVPSLPFISFGVSDTRLIDYRNDNPGATSGQKFELRDFDLAIKDVKNYGQNVGTTDGWFVGAAMPAFNVFTVLNKAQSANYNIVVADAFANDGSLPVTTRQNAVAFSPNAQVAAFANDLGLNILKYNGTGINYGEPVYDPTFFDKGIEYPLSALGWSPDSKYLVSGKKLTSGIQIWVRSGTDIGLAFELDEPTSGDMGGVQAIAWRFDGRYVAVSYNNAGVFTTVIYYRRGDYLIKGQTISNFGSMLNWLADGSYLLDAGQKKAQRYDGDGAMSSANGMMTNLQSAVGVAAISGQVKSAQPLPSIYDVALNAFTMQTVHTANIKVMLVKDAIYDQTATNLTALLAKEVSGSNWPAGGKVLTGVSYDASVAGTVKIKFDNVTQIITSPTLTLNGLVFYDATNSMPLMFVGYSSNVTIDSTKTISIEGAAGNLARFLA